MMAGIDYLRRTNRPHVYERRYVIDDHWCAHTLVKNDTVVGEHFHKYIANMEGCLERNFVVTGILDNARLDQMYVLLFDVPYDTTFMKRVYLLALSKMLCERGRLEFSTFQRKYAYMEKVDEMTLGVVAEIRERIAKNTLGHFLGIIITAMCVYAWL